MFGKAAAERGISLWRGQADVFQAVIIQMVGAMVGGMRGVSSGDPAEQAVQQGRDVGHWGLVCGMH